MSGSITALIPVRSFRGGKTRLAQHLSDERRAALSRWMFHRVLAAAHGSGVVASILVISPDAEVLTAAAAAAPDVVPLAQPAAAPGLNPALDLGRQWADERGRAAVLVLFADLPLLSGTDVANLARRDAAVVLAPDRHGRGTNALFLRLQRGGEAAADPFRFQFGEGSYARHVDEADRLGLDAVTVIAAGTTLDIDTPDDLQRLRGLDTTSGAQSAEERLEGALGA